MGKTSYVSVTDQFCGAGGSTTGAKQAGAEVVLALNHWELAVETHNTNHPDVAHECTDIQACDPRRYRSTTVLITSPECTNHSLAKGQKRKNQHQMDLFGSPVVSEEADRSRATMWDVVRFSEYHRYEVVVVENVVDARYWITWDAWKMAMAALGYESKDIYLNSKFFPPTPQSRDRMYVVFWRRGNKAPELEHRPSTYCPKCGGYHEAFQSWKNPGKKWGKYGQQYVYRCSQCATEVVPPFYAAWNAIDWSLRGERIMDRRKPLSENTIKRIESGLRRYGADPVLITSRYTSGIDCRVRHLTDAMPTQPADASHGICVPPAFILGSEYDADGGKTRSALDEVFWTQTTQQTTGVCVPPLIVENFGTSTAKPALKALGTITAGGINHGLLVGNYSPGWCRATWDAAGTITTNDHHGLVTSESLSCFLQYYYNGQQTSHVADAMDTVTTTDRAGIVKPAGVRVEDCEYRMLRPHEIQLAMAFPKQYRVLGSGRQQVKQLGNAVTPPVMQWIMDRVIKSLS